MELLCQYHTGEVVTSLQKTTLPGGNECLLYSTITGGLGAMLPLTSRSDVDFFTHLELHLRTQAPPLCGRDQLSYRSYFAPVKHVVDGDFCERFATLPAAKQQAIADELNDRTPQEVMKKLEDTRNRIV